MARKIAQFKLGDVVEVAAAGWGLAPQLIGATCTITSIACYEDRVQYNVTGLPGSRDLSSDAIWEQSFKPIPLTTGHRAALIADKMDAINKAIEKLKGEHAALLVDLLAVVETE